MLLQSYIDDIIKTALREDINYIDVTTDNLIPENHRSSAHYVAKDDGVLCGIEVAARVFELISQTAAHGAKIEFEKCFSDGSVVRKGDRLAYFSGSTSVLLKGERTALNLLQHMSGIATETAKCVAAVAGTGAMITDTRKTLAGLRALQKHAVIVGGGKNHRFNLSDAAMLKDNHIDAFGGIIPAVEELRKKIGHTVKIEVECDTLERVREAVIAKAEIIMLDNMDNAQMSEAVKLIDKAALVEASGNMTLERLRSVAETGVDIISIGGLTHSVKAFDISMKIKAC